MRLLKGAVAFALLAAVASGATAEPEGFGSAVSNRILKMVQGRAVPNGLGVNVHYDDEREDDLDLVTAMGFRVIRSDVSWSKVETRQGLYDWSATDSLVAKSRRRGLLPLLILAYSNPLYAPTWQGDTGRLDWAFEPPITDRARQAFVAFARAAAERYRGQVIWEVWNEPDLTFGKPARLDSYIRLATESCRAMRAAYPDAAIVGPASSGFARGLLEDFIKNDKEACFDAVSVHPYRDSNPESALRDWQRLDAIMLKWDRPQTKVAIDSEWGYSVQDGPWTERRQAEYVLRLYLVDLLAGVPITIIYDLRNDGPDPRDKEQNFGLLDADGKPKPVAGALTGMLRELNGLTVLGKIRTTSDDTAVLVFGAANRPLKLVAWSLASRPMRLRLGPELCLEPRLSTGHKCDSGDATIRMDPMTLDISGQPAVFEIQAERCSVPGKAAASFASWCESHQRTVR